MTKPLSGIKVIELDDYVSAPVCCRLLADMGAEVIKIERKQGSAWRVTARNYVPDRFTSEESPVYDLYNTGKKHIAIDLKNPEGIKLCDELLKGADVFVTNLRVAALKRLGLSYEDLKDKYPRLIYAIGLGYGEKGPMASEPAYDQTAFWARSGFLRDLAIIDGDNYMPIQPPASMGDTFTGTTLMGEICCALFNRERTGKGDYVRSSLYHNAIYAMGTMMLWSERPFGSEFPKTRPAHGIPNGHYRCKDGEYIYIAAGYTPEIVPKVFNMLGLPELSDDERFNTDEARRKNAAELFSILQARILEKTKDEWMQTGKEHDIPVSPMNHFADMAEDEQAWANGYVQNVSYPNGHTDVIASSPIEMDSVGELRTIPSPAVGADTLEVLKEAGISSDRIKELKDCGAI